MSNTISLYIHIPFCKEKCKYCDFYSLPSNILNNKTIKEYLTSIVNELEYYNLLLKNFEIDTIYFGGGTPNSIENYILDDFFYSFFSTLNKINKNHEIDKSEITVELNPQFISNDQILLIKKYPFNRISLGIQSLTNESLEFLGRNANLNETIDSIEPILSSFDNVSLDFILGLPNSNLEKQLKILKKYIKKYKSLVHLSFYILNIAEGTRLYQDIYQLSKESKNRILKEIENNSVIQYIKVCKFLKKMGFEHYEISNFARKKSYSRHNLRYWKSRPYLGLGASAHSYLYNIRYQNTCIKDYLSIWNHKICGKGYLGFKDNIFENKLKNKLENELENELVNTMKFLKRNYEILDNNKKLNEFIMLSLRTFDGLDVNELKNNFNTDFFKEKEEEIKCLQKKELVYIKNNRIKISENNFLFYNEIVRKLLF